MSNDRKYLWYPGDRGRIDVIRRLLYLSLVAGLCFGNAAQLRTLFIDRMGGMEKQLEDAIRGAEIPVDFIEEREHADLKILLGKQFTSVYAEILYTKHTGRKPGSALRAVDVKTGKEIVSQVFDENGGAQEQERAANAFARKLKAKLAAEK
jgi:hypothetical protein